MQLRAYLLGGNSAEEHVEHREMNKYLEIISFIKKNRKGGFGLTIYSMFQPNCMQSNSSKPKLMFQLLSTRKIIFLKTIESGFLSFDQV